MPNRMQGWATMLLLLNMLSFKNRQSFCALTQTLADLSRPLSSRPGKIIPQIKKKTRVVDWKFLCASACLLTTSIQGFPVQAQDVRVIRGYDLPPGKVVCLPKGEFARSRIVYCKESNVSATVGSKRGSVLTYTTPGGDTLTIFSPDFHQGACSIYRKKSCPVMAAFNSVNLRDSSVTLDRNMQELTVISYIVNGVRVLSLVEDRS
jgi:hypothetical protein